MGIKTKFFGKKNICFEVKNGYYNLYLNKNRYKIKKLNLHTNFELENLECAILCCLLLKINEKKIINT